MVASPVRIRARAFRCRRLLDEGRYASISEMAKTERIERGYLGTLLRLTLLAPNLVEAVLDGRQPMAANLAALMEPFPTRWAEQAFAPRSVLECGSECCRRHDRTAP